MKSRTMRYSCYGTVLVFIFMCLSCSKPFTITASVNKVAWYGTGLATQASPEKTANCPVKRFGLFAMTDIPYGVLKPARTSGCEGNCTPTQLIDFYNLPLAKGKYYLTLPDPCLPPNLAKARIAYLRTDPNGAHVLKGTSVTTVDDFAEMAPKSWVRVTKYDAASGLVKGKFELTLANKKGETLTVKNGKFKAKL